MRKMRFLLILSLFLAYGCAITTQSEQPAPTQIETVPEEISSELVIVYDNNPFDNRLQTAWGFSCLIRLPQESILFDTGGDSSILLDNMKQLHINPGEIDSIVLSHIHGDHVGGLSGFLEQNSAITLYIPQSFPESFKDEAESLGAKVQEISEATELCSGVYTTGELGDSIKEQSLIVTGDEGLIIITGCAHPGVVNIIRRAKDIVPDREIYLVLGGFHMSGASLEQIESVIREFGQLSVEKVAPCHCSGDETRRLFKKQYAENYIESGVGKRLPLP
jgi:7,8-dihydropterin-6-yl-methyl-4-(beta-D-ribofuranosyl)aminobenzene 5'-phosphate synthase